VFSLTSLFDGLVNELKALWEVSHEVCVWCVLHLQAEVGEQQGVAGEQSQSNLTETQQRGGGGGGGGGFWGW